MATYSIKTSREQEAGLNFMYEKYKTENQTKEQYLQIQVNQSVLNPMFAEWKRSQGMALDASIATIPESNEAKANLEIQSVIIENGGTIITVDELPGGSPIPAGFPGGDVPAPRGSESNPIQVGGAVETDVSSSGPNGAGDIES